MYDFLLIASVLALVATCFLYIRHPAASLLHPASWYLAFHGFVFVLRPLVARWYDFDFVYRIYDFQPSISDKITVILGANLAMAAFVLVSLWVAPRPVSISGEAEHRHMRRALAWPILIAAGLLTPLAVASQTNNWRIRINDFDTMAFDPGTGAQINIEGSGWFAESALMMAPLAVMIVWLARYRWWGWSYFALFALLQAGTGGRGPLIYAFAAVAVLFLLERGRKWFDWRPLTLALLAALAFNQLVVDRGGFVREALGQDGSSYRTTARDLDPLEHMDFANLEYFEYLVYAVPQRTGSWDYFANNLQIFTEPIPRAIWDDKPVGSPVQFFSLWDYGQPIGMTASLPGMGWISLGYAGIAIQAAVFAALFALLYNWLLVRRRNAVARLSYALAIAMAVIVFRDGTLLTLLRLTPFYLGPLLLVLAFARLAGLGQTVPLRAGVRTPAGTFLAQSPGDRRRALAHQASRETGTAESA